MCKPITSFVLGCALGLITPPAAAQGLADKIDRVRGQQASRNAAQDAEREEERAEARRQQALSDVDLRDLQAREAVEWLAAASGVQIVVNWDRLAENGIDPEQPVTLAGRGLSAARGLDLIVKQISIDEPLMWEVDEHFVEIITKEQANQRAEVKIYPIHDLLHEVPDFDNAPEFDLQQIAQQGSQGGQGGGSSGGGGSGGSLFNESDSGEEDDDDRDTAARAEELAELIRQTIEPDIWRENGGLHGSIRFYNGNLIIRAPKYVHRQIGGGGRSINAKPSVGRAGTAGEGVGVERRYVQMNVNARQGDVTGLRRVPFSAASPGPSRASRSRDAGIQRPIIGD